MKKRWKYLVLLCLASFYNMPETQSQVAGLFSSGTLIVTIGCKEGILVCADKLTRDSIRGKVDGEKKILECNESIVIGTTGNSTYYQAFTNSLTGQVIVDFKTPLFDAAEVARKYYQKARKDESIVSDAQILAAAINDSFNHCFSKRPESTWPAEQTESDFELFNVVVSQYNKTNNIFEFLLIKFKYKKQLGPKLTWNEVHGFMKPDRISKSFVECYGELKIIDELKANYKKFSDWDTDGILSNLISSSTRSDDLSLAQAKNVAARLTALSSVYLPETSNPVGLTVDMVLIASDGKLQWLEKGTHVSKIDSVSKTQLGKVQ